MTTSGQKLLAAIHEVAAHERGEIQLNTVSVPIKSVADWRQAAEWAQSRIADLEAEVARLREALKRIESICAAPPNFSDATIQEVARTALKDTK